MLNIQTAISPIKPKDAGCASPPARRLAVPGVARPATGRWAEKMLASDPLRQLTIRREAGAQCNLLSPTTDEGKTCF